VRVDSAGITTPFFAAVCLVTHITNT